MRPRFKQKMRTAKNRRKRRKDLFGGVLIIGVVIGAIILVFYSYKKVKPGKLVLSHILFWGSSPVEILREVQENYKGKVIIAEDLMVVD